MDYNAYGNGGDDYQEYGGYDAGTQQGGYMHESPRTANSQQNRGERLNFISQVTIAQLSDAESTPENGFVVNGHPLSKIQIIGRIRSLEPKNTNIEMEIEDGTGMFTCVKWADDTAENLTDRFSVGMYVAVFGQLRVFNDKRSINVFQIREVTDHNEITQHMLTAILTHLQLTRGYLNKNIRNAMNKSSAHDPMEVTPVNHPQGTFITGEAITTDTNSEYSSIERKVFEVYSNPRVETIEIGLHVSECIQEIRKTMSNVQENEVRDAIKKLCDEGQLYSTVDDDHYKYTGEAN